ncbi:MAG: ABC transporter permease [Treponema sp.]|jgi:hypothetical protein|nr:ABC transporter permease [Treponema sp.]
MRSFFDLVGFEYKKIFKRNTAIISLVLLVIIAAIVCTNPFAGNSYWHSENGTPLLEAMNLDRETARSRAGYIDEAFLNEAIAKNAFMISDDNNYLISNYGKYIKFQAYIDYVLPYEIAVRLINVMYEPDFGNLSTDGARIINLNDIKPIDTLTSLRENEFYARINQTISGYINSRPSLSEAEREKHIRMMSRVKTPFYNDYYEAYSKFAQNLQGIALILFVAVAVCIAPVFSGEYQLKTDQTLLSSKYGKNKMIFAKFFTGASFTLILTVIILFGSLFLFLIMHGFSGSDMAIQTLDFFSTYPLTILQAVLIAIVVTIFVTLSYSMFVMWLSSYFKSPFSVVIVAFLMLFMPALVFISPNNRLPYQLLQLFPAKATEFFNIFSVYFFDFSGVIFTPAEFYIVFSSAVLLILVPFIYRSFRNHQIG